jgi:hypothetical protein
MAQHDLDRYALHWLFGWPEPGKLQSKMERPDIACGLRSELALTPQILRLAWQRRRDVKLIAWHDAAQRLATLFSNGALKDYARNLRIATADSTFGWVVASLRKARQMQNSSRLHEEGFAKAVAGHRQTLMLKVAQEAKESLTQNPGPAAASRGCSRAIKIHSFTAPEGSFRRNEKAEERIRLREKLATPKHMAGPQDRHACDELFAQLYAESPWLSTPLTYLWRAAVYNVVQRSEFWMPPTILVGPPGCGKTHIAEQIGALSGCTALRIDMSSVNATFSLTGSEFTWASSDAGRPIEHIAESGAANPVILLDELEKRGVGGSGGDAATALLPLLQPNTAAAFQSPYLGAQIDLSRISWIISVNDVERLPKPLIDRTQILYCAAPTGEHLRQLVMGILGKGADPEVIDLAINGMEAGRSLRWLQRIAVQFKMITEWPTLQ